jgi:hypothetical protein
MKTRNRFSKRLSLGVVRVILVMLTGISAPRNVGERGYHFGPQRTRW